jgi:hypothetical protein
MKGYNARAPHLGIRLPAVHIYASKAPCKRTGYRDLPFIKPKNTATCFYTTYTRHVAAEEFHRDGDYGSAADTTRGTGGAAGPALFEVRREISKSSTLSKLLDVVAKYGRTMTAEDVACAWQVAGEGRMFRGANPSLLPPSAALLLEVTEHLVPSMTPSLLSTTAWGLAASEFSDAARAINAIMAAAAERLLNFRPQDLCVLLWVASVSSGLEAKWPSLLLGRLAALLERGMSLDLFSTRDISVLIWACASTGFWRGPLAGSTIDAAIARVDEFAPQDATRLMQGLAAMGLRHNGLIRPLVKRCRAHMKEYGPEDLAGFVVSVAKLMSEPGELHFSG